MKHTGIKWLTSVALLLAIAACGNQSGHSGQLDTVPPAATPLPVDTTAKDTMVNNGERLQGSDTSARHR